MYVVTFYVFEREREREKERERERERERDRQSVCMRVYASSIEA